MSVSSYSERSTSYGEAQYDPARVPSGGGPEDMQVLSLSLSVCVRAARACVRACVRVRACVCVCRSPSPSL